MKKFFENMGAIVGVLTMVWILWSVGEVAMCNTEVAPQYSNLNFFIVIKSIMQ